MTLLSKLDDYRKENSCLLARRLCSLCEFRTNYDTFKIYTLHNVDVQALFDAFRSRVDYCVAIPAFCSERPEKYIDCCL